MAKPSYAIFDYTGSAKMKSILPKACVLMNIPGPKHGSRHTRPIMLLLFDLLRHYEQESIGQLAFFQGPGNVDA